VKRPALPLVLIALALPGCSVGSNDASSDDEDTLTATLTCLTDEKDLAARASGEQEILVGDPESGARIVFYLTAGEAEAVQFEGDAEGAEQIGSALLHVREGSDEDLEAVEECLADQ